jgi:hypothetical protein
MIGVGACADKIVSLKLDQLDRRITAHPGQEIRIALGNAGPAEYETPPQISSTAVSYLGVDVVPPYNPGGPTQLFRFRAVHSGEAIVIFRRRFGDSVVSTVRDTIEVH